MLEKGKQGIKGEWTKNGKRLICFFSGTELHGKRIEQDPVGRRQKRTKRSEGKQPAPF